MAQLARPVSDIVFANDAIYLGNPDNTDRYKNLDEVTQDNADKVFVKNAYTGSAYVEFGLSAVTDPNSSSGHIVRYSYCRVFSGNPNGSGNSVNSKVSLYQGSTLIAEKSVTGITTGSYVADSFTLTSGEADAITDYSALSIRLFGNGGAGGPPINQRGVAWSWLEFEVPDVSDPSGTPRSFGVIIGL